MTDTNLGGVGVARGGTEEPSGAGYRPLSPASQTIDAELMIARELFKRQYPATIDSFGRTFEMISLPEKKYYYDMAQQHLKKHAVLVPVQTKFQLGQQVEYCGAHRGCLSIVIGIGQALDGTIVYLTQPVERLLASMYAAYPENVLQAAVADAPGQFVDEVV